MPTYSLHAATIGSFPLGEADKILTLFSSERGIVRAVAKGARKPGAKISGRADVLNVNKLLLAKGRSLDIITQAEGMESFPALRKDLVRLSYALYYAELTQQFGQGLSEESDLFFAFLISSLRLQADQAGEPSLLCLEFELELLNMLGYRPELDCCVVCRSPVTDYNVSAFHYDLGGIVCASCFNQKAKSVRENSSWQGNDVLSGSGTTHITPLVWKRLVLASQSQDGQSAQTATSQAVVRANQAGRRIIQGYIEHRAGRRMKSLDLLTQI